ncbi:MAG: 4-(cytidine 5'-diphospho)-2-C-methyl-D-erythritol kinase [Oscillospiraceae bacterium]|nr:4-(cytidine 5'-diphospho)-2-C-methyl-D-erythritol kinase [Oscillospiraceae bacterium]
MPGLIDADCYQVKYRAYAKINLTLNVTGRRPDGYHELESVMQAVSLCDDVTVRLTPKQKHMKLQRDGIHVAVTARDTYIKQQCVPVDGRNSAYKAAEIFFAKQAPPVTYDADIRIHKRIPAAAGLAGGSSDAAAVLRALNDIASLRQTGGAPHLRRLPEDELLECALGVGADVPFCLLCATSREGAAPPPSGAALATGIGEVLRPLPGFKPGYAVALANPRVEVSTARVFKEFKLQGAASAMSAMSAIKCTEYARALTNPCGEPLCGGENLRGREIVHYFNVLEDTVIGFCPQIKGLKARMEESGALCALMSGSGPTVFGLFDKTVAASRAVAKIRSGGDWAALCKFI